MKLESQSNLETTFRKHMQKAGARAVLLSHGDTLPTAKLKKEHTKMKMRMNFIQTDFH